MNQSKLEAEYKILKLYEELEELEEQFAEAKSNSAAVKERMPTIGGRSIKYKIAVVQRAIDRYRNRLQARDAYIYSWELAHAKRLDILEKQEDKISRLVDRLRVLEMKVASNAVTLTEVSEFATIGKNLRKEREKLAIYKENISESLFRKPREARIGMSVAILQDQRIKAQEAEIEESIRAGKKPVIDTITDDMFATFQAAKGIRTIQGLTTDVSGVFNIPEVSEDSDAPTLNENGEWE